MAEAVKKEEVKPKGPIGKIQDFAEDKEIHHEIVSLEYMGENSEYDI